MTRRQAVAYRFEGVFLAVWLAVSGLLFWAAVYRPGERVRPHHAPDYAGSVFGASLATVVFAVAVWRLFARPDKADRAE